MGATPPVPPFAGRTNKVEDLKTLIPARRKILKVKYP